MRGILSPAWPAAGGALAMLSLAAFSFVMKRSAQTLIFNLASFSMDFYHSSGGGIKSPPAATIKHIVCLYSLLVTALMKEQKMCPHFFRGVSPLFPGVLEGQLASLALL